MEPTQSPQSPANSEVSLRSDKTGESGLDYMTNGMHAVQGFFDKLNSSHPFTSPEKIEQIEHMAGMHMLYGRKICRALSILSSIWINCKKLTVDVEVTAVNGEEVTFKRHVRQVDNEVCECPVTTPLPLMHKGLYDGREAFITFNQSQHAHKVMREATKTVLASFCCKMEEVVVRLKEGVSQPEIRVFEEFLDSKQGYKRAEKKLETTHYVLRLTFDLPKWKRAAVLAFDYTARAHGWLHYVQPWEEFEAFIETEISSSPSTPTRQKDGDTNSGCFAKMDMIVALDTAIIFAQRAPQGLPMEKILTLPDDAFSIARSNFAILVTNSIVNSLKRLKACDRRPVLIYKRGTYTERIPTCDICTCPFESHKTLEYSLISDKYVSPPAEVIKEHRERACREIQLPPGFDVQATYPGWTRKIELWLARTVEKADPNVRPDNPVEFWDGVVRSPWGIIPSQDRPYDYRPSG
ncbi:hypothetical protein K490DRAFT_63858 [Saccharata proteae CBS 121410]|uniref:Uncharacterized protein n=1 Tax=Saccharata proteae CBS 121410 TaxID=1314787 RepID=A0A6A5YFX8_9PEZI|nr:hypothetical protein K490DRAFT_63858 [Saccharata proteae CBS 121410]